MDQDRIDAFAQAAAQEPTATRCWPCWAGEPFLTLAHSALDAGVRLECLRIGQGGLLAEVAQMTSDVSALQFFYEGAS
ncbi:hypothetical protein QTI17_29580 [Variovorax sp. J31P179]|uniref:hypothetical protein n=1 Tax=Variovorax sp. J31P179 TaxID=3053508 RepID=UPI0025788B66|nr:hypothetical protein [Variovorax sp. J31P179]MDM0084759.1 hypothetical protein [Variovorax sp. J31P179]